ncbi:MAG: hypothetical protein ACQGVC_01300 [Myxococcota bacterium]
MKRAQWHGTLAVLALLALGCASLLPGEPERVAVYLTFGWEPGLEMDVTTKRTWTQKSPERIERSATTRSRLRVEDAGNRSDLLVRRTDYAVTLGDDFEAVERGALVEGLPRVVLVEPDVVVTREGHFARILDPAAFNAKVWGFVRDSLPWRIVHDPLQERIMTRQRAQLIEKLTAVSRGDLASSWNALAGTWSGAGLWTGSPIERTAVLPMELLPGQTVTWSFVHTARRIVPCSRRGSERTCVELEIRAAPDAGELERAVRRARNYGDPRSLGPPVVESIEVENLFRLTTEPDGLHPHAAFARRHHRIGYSRQKLTWELEETDEIETTYAYR